MLLDSNLRYAVMPEWRGKSPLLRVMDMQITPAEPRSTGVISFRLPRGCQLVDQTIARLISHLAIALHYIRVVTNKLHSVKKTKGVEFSTPFCFVCSSGGRWGCWSPIKILTTSIYRPFQPLFFTIWSHIGLRKIVPYFCKYNDSSWLSKLLMIVDVAFYHQKPYN